MHYSTALEPLLQLGYIPLPLIPKDKRPAIKNWTATDYTPPKGYGGHGVGIKCGSGEYPIAAVDIDITDPEFAKEMQAFVEELCGKTVFRIGKAPKMLLVYLHASTGARKQTSARFECGRIEVLGAGQQFVAFGTHPDTKQPYKWPEKSITDIKAEDLFIIDGKQIREIIAQFEDLAEVKGFEKISQEKTTISNLPDDDFDPDDPLDQVEPVGLKIDECKSMLADLDPDSSRDEWLNIGMALHHEFRGSAEAMQIWDEWSARGEKYKQGEPEKYWNGFGNYRGRPITAAYLLKITKKEDIWEEPDFFKKLSWSTSRFLSDPPGIPMVINGFLPRGIVSLFYSAGGAGKSTIVLDMAIRIALAKKYDLDFLGHSIQGGKAVIVTAEDPELILNRRFMGIVEAIADEEGVDREEIRKTIDENLFIVSTFGHSVQLFKLKTNGILVVTEYYKSLMTCLKEIENLHFVVIDTKTRYSPGEGLGNVTATQEITHYEAMAKETGASLMLLHHSNKSSRDGSQTGAQAYRDATALFDSVRAAWYLRGLTDMEMAAQNLDENNGSYLLLENSKNNYIPCNQPMIVHREGYKYSPRQMLKKMSTAERKELRKQEAYDKVVEVVQSERGEWHTQSEIIALCRNAKIGRDRVIAALRDAEENGLLDKIQEGVRYKFALTESGKLYNVTIE